MLARGTFRHFHQHGSLENACILSRGGLGNSLAWTGQLNLSVERLLRGLHRWEHAANAVHIGKQAVFPQQSCQKPGLCFPIASPVELISLTVSSIVSYATVAYQGKGSGETFHFSQMIEEFANNILLGGSVLLKLGNSCAYHSTRRPIADLKLARSSIARVAIIMDKTPRQISFITAVQLLNESNLQLMLDAGDLLGKMVNGLLEAIASISIDQQKRKPQPPAIKSRPKKPYHLKTVKDRALKTSLLNYYCLLNIGVIC